MTDIMSVAAVPNQTVTSPVVGTGATGTTGSAPTTPTTDPNGINGANANTFLQLLVAQLQYQNPDSPTDPTQMMSETASFEEVTQLDNIQQSLTSMASATQASTAVSLLGQTVSGTDANGNPVTGVVSSVNLNAGKPLLTVGSNTLPLSGVSTISQPATTPSTSTTTGTPS